MIEVEQQKLALGANADQDVKPNKRFKNFNDVFSGLTRSKNVQTNNPIVSCIITYDSKSAITITKASDFSYKVKQYSLENYISSFEEVYKGSYIKMKEIEQDEAGKVFAVPYFNNGVFKIRMFEIPEFETMDIKTQIKRTDAEIEKRELNINEALGLDDHTMPIDNFPDPFINCCFIDGKKHEDGSKVKYVFVNLFYSKD